MPVIDQSGATARIDQIINDITGKWRQQNQASNVANQNAQTGLSTPTLETPSNKLNLLDALGTTGGEAAFLRGATGAKFQKGAPSRLTNVASAIPDALDAGQASQTANVNARNSVEIARSQANNQLLMDKAKLAQPTANIGSVLAAETSKLNTERRIQSNKELAQQKAQAGSGGATIANVLSSLRLGNQQKTIDTVDAQDILAQPAQFAGDLFASGEIQNREPLQLDPRAVDANKRTMDNFRQNQILGATTGIPPKAAQTDLFVHMPERDRSFFSLQGLNPNVMMKTEKITLPAADMSFIAPLIEQAGFNMFDAVNMAKSIVVQSANDPTAGVNQGGQKQALVNFISRYDPIINQALSEE